MIEDESFNAFLKGKLEEDVKIPQLQFPRGCLGDREVNEVSQRMGWRQSLLLAASFAVLCGMFAWMTIYALDSRQERNVARAIEFLEECQALALDVAPPGPGASGTIAERLLAWQDAPFEEIADM